LGKEQSGGSPDQPHKMMDPNMPSKDFPLGDNSSFRVRADKKPIVLKSPSKQLDSHHTQTPWQESDLELPAAD